MQGKWVPVRGYVGSGRRLQTCTTKENAISAFVLASSLPHRLSKSSAGACPPPLSSPARSHNISRNVARGLVPRLLAMQVISQLSCLLELSFLRSLIDGIGNSALF